VTVCLKAEAEFTVKAAVWIRECADYSKMCRSGNRGWCLGAGFVGMGSGARKSAKPLKT
jgi:hypothetical protein